MDELRTKIWDYLYRESGPKSLDEIAKHVESDAISVQAAVNHQWFEMVTDRVAIAYGTNPSRSTSLTDRLSESS